MAYFEFWIKLKMASKTPTLRLGFLREGKLLSSEVERNENVFSFPSERRNQKAIAFYFSLFSVLMHLVQTLAFIPFTFLVWMLMAKVRFVAMFEWLREFPEVVPRPHMLHVRLIVF